MNPSGKYQVIQRLDAGGMAEVFVAWAEGLEGFRKKVAIKRVLPQLVENKKFLAMFLDEARLSLRLNHANVAQVFDIGAAAGTYFIVMEYVEGTNLKRIMETMRAREQLVPLAQSLYIVGEICKGLAYAHGLTDSEGHSLGIVHRDVSPPNILLSLQGEVKLVDFGLAKASSQLEHTDPGVVKGKFAYLSPEAAYGQQVDHRADVFACGVILHELITGRRLFLGQNDLDTVELVRRCHPPSITAYNPAADDNLDQIVQKALARDPADRYQSCTELGEALADHLFSRRLRVTGFDLKRMVTEGMREDERRQPKGAGIEQLIQEELVRFSSLENSSSNVEPGDPEVAAAGARPLDLDGFAEREMARGGTGSLFAGRRTDPNLIVAPLAVPSLDELEPLARLEGDDPDTAAATGPEPESVTDGEIRLGAAPSNAAHYGQLLLFIYFCLLGATVLAGAVVWFAGLAN